MKDGYSVPIDLTVRKCDGGHDSTSVIERRKRFNVSVLYRFRVSVPSHSVGPSSLE